MNKKQRIMIVEDQKILREGLKALLSVHPNLQVVGEAENGLEALRKVDKLLPDLILMDLSMPKMNGIEAIQELRKKWPEIKIVALTAYDMDEYISGALKAGADGYLLKESNGKELIKFINNVLAGKQVLSPGISHQIIEGYLQNQKGKASQS